MSILSGCGRTHARSQNQLSSATRRDWEATYCLWQESVVQMTKWADLERQNIWKPASQQHLTPFFTETLQHTEKPPLLSEGRSYILQKYKTHSCGGSWLTFKNTEQFKTDKISNFLKLSKPNLAIPRSDYLGCDIQLLTMLFNHHRDMKLFASMVLLLSLPFSAIW